MFNKEVSRGFDIDKCVIEGVREISLNINHEICYETKIWMSVKANKPFMEIRHAIVEFYKKTLVVECFKMQQTQDKFIVTMNLVGVGSPPII